MIAETYLSQVNILPATVLHPVATILHTAVAQQDRVQLGNVDASTLTGQAKTADVSNNVPKKTVHPTTKPTKPKMRPRESPRVGAGKPDKIPTKPRKMSDTKSDYETEVGDADVLIVHDSTKHTHLEPTQPGSKRKHDDGPGPTITTEGTEATTPASPKRSADASQPPLPPYIPKPPLPMGPPKSPPPKTTSPKQSLPPSIPSLSLKAKSPLKPAAAHSRVTKSEPTLTYATKRQDADTTSLRRPASWNRAKSPPKRHASLSHTGTPSISDEDYDDLRGQLNELHENRRNCQTLSTKRSQRSLKVMSGNIAKPYNVLPRRNGYDHTKGTFANSDREQCGTDDDKGPQWEPISEYENRSIKGPQRGTMMRYRSRNMSDRSGSDSDNRSNQSARSKGSNQSLMQER